MQPSTIYLDLTRQSSESTVKSLSTMKSPLKRKREQDQVLATKCQMLEASIRDLQKHLKSVRDHVSSHPPPSFTSVPMPTPIPTFEVKTLSSTFLQNYVSNSSSTPPVIELDHVLPFLLKTLEEIKEKTLRVPNYAFLCKVGSVLDHSLDIISQVQSGHSNIVLLPVIQQALDKYRIFKSEGVIRINYKNRNNQWQITDGILQLPGNVEAPADLTMYPSLESWFGFPQQPLMVASTGVFTIHTYYVTISEQ